MARRCMAAVLLLLSLVMPAAAEDFAFGGRGEDALYEAVSCGDGLFAVGKTTSSDGDLSSRTRTGETGWAIRVDGDGARMWDFCSAKSGMFRMTAPHAHADGTFSLVLTDEGRTKGEWIVLDGRGRQQSRVPLPAADALCPNGKSGDVLRWAAASGSTGPYLALLLDHGDGTLCCAALFADGGVRTCGEFEGQGGYMLADETRGGLMHVGAQGQTLRLTRLRPGSPPQAVVCESGESLLGVSDALLFEDGSAVVCGAAQGGTLALRVSAAGELIFAHRAADAEMTLLAETDAGFAAYAPGSVRFFDEDGQLLGRADAPQGALDLLRGDGGVLALTHLDARGVRQAAFTRVAQPDFVPQPEITPAPEKAPAQQAQPEHGALALGDGHLVCEAVYGGATVSYVDAQGIVRWRTRTPIHTAADRLIWESAQVTPEGDILLTGRYETDVSGGVNTEGAQALLSADGVLRGIEVAQ